jgi:flagellar FliL protein
MKKLLKFLPRILIVLAVIPLIALIVFMAYINFAMACTVFQPETLPAPIGQMCQSSSEAPAQTADEGTAIEPASAQAAAPEENATGEKPPSAPLEIKPGQGLRLDTGTKIVNLVDPTGRKYLRAGIVLEFAPPDLGYYTMTAEEKTAFTEGFNQDVTEKLPVINDILITALSTQTFDSVYTAEGKEALRKTIQETINKQLPEYRVIFVYFTEFVVQ